MKDSEEFLRIMGKDVYAHHTGIEVLTAEPGYSKTRLPVSPETLNGHGNLHGGALFTLADYTAAIASNMLGVPTVAVNGNIQYLRSVRGGSVTCEARVIKTGKRMNFMTVEIRNDQDDLVATFQGGAMTVVRKDV
ncbi:MAG: PaaI family thioesterase [Planctomycetes bacterium]|nr:PaaI family thioesterase [Planctomycetota bacterium]MCC8115566.1 PaaI family thioesterase [Planctomycetota bacterium]MCD7897563.1 PaaI family thioesterase [Planctomycetaceae bacterium]